MRHSSIRAGGVLAPSDLRELGTKALTAELRVGGRVEWIDGCEVVLADALGSIRVAAPECLAGALAAGDLVVLRVVRDECNCVAHSIERRDRYRTPQAADEWARFVWSGKARRLAARAKIRRSLEQWFELEGFLEVETPTRLRAPGLDSDIDAISSEERWLVTSPELCMKRLLVGGFPRIYQFARCFRRGELGSRHEPEFTMLEWYRSHADLSAVLDDTEALVVAAANALELGESCSVRGRRISIERPFLRMSVADAFRLHAGIEDVAMLARDDRDRYFQLFVEQVEPSLSEYARPVFLCDYPATEAALARVRSDDPRWAERAELYFAGVELCNGYSELSAAGEQRARFVAELENRAATGRPTYPLDEPFLAALEQGMPDSAGNALGFDRLVMLLVDALSIDQVIAFPESEL